MQSILIERLWVRPAIEEDVLSKARNVSPTTEEEDEGTESAVPGMTF
jgi:hypothetical protein